MKPKTIARAVLVASLAWAAGTALADNSSPFPSAAAGNDVDQPYVAGGTYAEQHHADTARVDGSSFPSAAAGNDVDQPYVPGGTYAERHHANTAHADGSSFPWVPDENDADMLATPPMSRFAAGKSPASDMGE